MRLILDSNEYIFGFDENSGYDASIRLIKKIPRLIDEIEDFLIIVPNIIRKEVSSNLPEELVRQFYRFLRSSSKIVLRWQDVVVPELYVKYSKMLKEEDALIAAIAEAEQIDCLISDNRHFYERLQVDVFLTLTAEAFLQAMETGEIWQRIERIR